MARKRRLSARQHSQRVEQRKAGTRGFDRGGSRRSIFRSKWAKIFFAVGLVGIIGSLVPLLLLGNSGSPHGGSQSAADRGSQAGPAPVSQLVDPEADAEAAAATALDGGLGEVEGKPQFAAPPELTLDPAASYTAVMTLEDGSTVEIELFADTAPIHANNFIFLAEQGFYDGLTFHRVLPDFVAQGGDPTATGSGGAGYTLPDEAVGANAEVLSLEGEGVIAMARGGQGASSSQFFITLTPQGGLDPQGFTAFGRVVSGFDAVQGITLRDPNAVPAPPAGTRIVSVTILQEGGAEAVGSESGDEGEAGDDPAVEEDAVDASGDASSADDGASAETNAETNDEAGADAGAAAEDGADG